MASCDMYIESRFAQVHPDSEPAPIYKMGSNNSSTTSATTSRERAIQTCPKHDRMPSDESIGIKFCIRFDHLWDPDGAAQQTSLGTPNRTTDEHSGTLRIADIRTENTKILYGYDYCVEMDKNRTRDPARRLQAARGWFDYFISTHETCVEGGRCCKSMYKRYPYPAVRAVEVDEEALEQPVVECADAEVREGVSDDAAGGDCESSCESTVDALIAKQ